jgi:lipid-binding SYLF domain-containing protein
MKTIFHHSRILKFTVLMTVTGGLALSAKAQPSVTPSPQNVNGQVTSPIAPSAGSNASSLTEAVGPDAKAAAIREKLNEQLSEAADFYLELQGKPQTSIPNHVVVEAKGILMINRWSTEVGGRATGGYAIGMTKLSDGKFSAPVFYTLSGASLGMQADGKESHQLIFLMTDKAVRTLTDSKPWKGNIAAVAGPTATKDTPTDNQVDAFVYLNTPNTDIATAVSTINIAPDDERTRIFYKNGSITADDVFAGGVKAPVLSKQIISYYLNDQSKNINPTLPPTETPGIVSAELPTASGAALGPQTSPGSTPSVDLH